jgi:hypothetical protein
MANPRLSDWLVPMVCTVVFVAELVVIGAVFSGVDVGKLLPANRSPDIRSETTSLPAPETALKDDESRPGPLVLPLVAPLSAPTAPVPDRANYGEPLKVEKSRRHQAQALRPAGTVNGGDKYGLANAIYRPGSRAPGW